MVATKDSTPRCAVGDFDISPIRRLARILAEPDKQVRRKQCNDLGVVDSAFIETMCRSFGLCKRAALMYPGVQDLSVSFNGGKDACVVLYLWLAAVEALHEPDTEPRKQSVIFFDSSDEFDEVRNFVSWVVSSLNLDMVMFQGQSFRAGMENAVEKGIRAVVMGQRRGDPWMKGVDNFSPSTEGWPAFMRINPIMDWSYRDVWTFLRCFGLPYCMLYDTGYTSLGSVATTFRNPALRKDDGSYSPAFELTDEILERSGRMSRQVSEAESAKAKAESSDSDGPAYERKNRKQPVIKEVEVARSAGIIIVGDEILSGKVRDSNAQYLCEKLHSRGVCVKRMETVSDDIYAIAKAVESMSAACDFVFTSGGLGPTHDDVTVAGVAAAFKCRLVRDEKFFSMLTDFMTKGGERMLSTTACHKMATVPEGALMEWPCESSVWPILSMRNVYVFAGMPSTCRDMFERAASDGRFTGAHSFSSATLQLDAYESEIVDALQLTVDAYPNVCIGSYPSTEIRACNVTDHCGTPGDNARACRLTITFEAFDNDMVEEARAHLVNSLPASLILKDLAAGA